MTQSEFILSAIHDPAAAADYLDTLAERLRAAAVALREVKPITPTPPANDFTAPAGISDRVQVRVVGPDGDTKYYTDSPN